MGTPPITTGMHWDLRASIYLKFKDINGQAYCDLTACHFLQWYHCLFYLIKQTKTKKKQSSLLWSYSMRTEPRTPLWTQRKPRSNWSRRSCPSPGVLRCHNIATEKYAKLKIRVRIFYLRICACLFYSFVSFLNFKTNDWCNFFGFIEYKMRTHSSQGLTVIK